MAENLNEIIRKAAAGSVLRLPAGEFEGPVTINKPLHIVGSGTTVWAKRGAAITVNSDGVTLENLRVELTESPLSDIAITTSSNTAVKGVEVLGKVRGFGAADGVFDVPRTIELGEFAAGERNTFLMTVVVPDSTEIACDMRSVEFSPSRLQAGRNTVTVTAEDISAGTLLYTEVLFRSAFTRRIYLTGKPVAGIPAVSERVLYTAPQNSEGNAPAADVISIAVSSAISSKTEAKAEKTVLQRGQRVELSQCIDAKFSVFFTGDIPRGWEVDPYVFVVSQSGKVSDDRRLVFFGNASSPDGAAAYFPQNGRVEIDLAKTSADTAKIVLAYSIYAGGAGRTFSGIKSPCVKLWDDKERVEFHLDGLSDEVSVVAMEFYRYKGEWKISAVGSGYNDGVARLCNYYGLEVIQE